MSVLPVGASEDGRPIPVKKTKKRENKTKMGSPTRGANVLFPIKKTQNREKYKNPLLVRESLQHIYTV